MIWRAPRRPSGRHWCPTSPPCELADDQSPRAARWCTLVSRSTSRTRTVSVAQLFDRARPAAVLGQPCALSLGHAARARNKSCPGLVALASPCAGARYGTLMQTSSCGSEFILLDGSKCAALTRWMVSTVFASKSRQEWVDVLASPAGRGRTAVRRGRTCGPCRVARCSNLIKPLLWQLGQHVCCLSPAAH